METQINPNQPGSKIPEPPPLEIDIRTMESDLKAFQEGGGEVPGFGTKKTFTPKAQEVPDDMPDIKIRGYSGPEKAIFDSAGSSITSANGSGAKSSFGIVIAVIVIIVLGLLGYYVVFPLIFK